MTRFAIPGKQYSKDPLKNTLLERAMKENPGIDPWESPFRKNPGEVILSQSQERAFPDLRNQETAPTVPTAPTGLPAPTPSAQPAKVPPAWKRYATALKMQQGYANGWEPHPIITRLLGGQ